MKNLVVLSSIILGLFFFTSCEKSENSSDELAFAYSDNMDLYLNQINFVDSVDLTDTDTETLVFMKEEEKLARDVYSYLFEEWNAQVFSNIAQSEQKHLDAIIRLMSFYGLEDTTVLEQGVFNDPNLAELYTTLTEKGVQSIEDAFTVGAMIEDLDIKDLQDYLETSENENIELVFNNLLSGSENHLRAFNRQLVNLGVTYMPTYISQEQFDAIMATENQKGNKQGKGKGNGKGYQNGQQNKGNGTGTCDGTGTGNQNRGNGKRGN